jgi:peptide deformylase
MDHLIGKLFVDRMTDMSTLAQLAEFDEYWKQEPATVI